MGFRGKTTTETFPSEISPIDDTTLGYNSSVQESKGVKKLLSFRIMELPVEYMLISSKQRG